MSIVQTGGTGSAILLDTRTLTSEGNCSIGVMGTMTGHVTLKTSYAGDSDNAEGSASTSLYV